MRHGILVKNSFCTWRCQRGDNENTSPVPQYLDRHALRSLVFAQRQQPRECWLCEADQRAEVTRRTEVTSRRRWLSVSHRKCVLQCPDCKTTPGCDATHSLQARRQITRRATATCDTPHHKVWMRHATDHTANNVASYSKPFKKARARSP